ncbi:DNA cytosine methyltransferase [Glycomyces sp. A-F 0318]|uniref:DNA cytosine methyltransferase n=1 Tax=Glycomyces amatae TaxID=2881355 RepID=UPI001E508A30|nr:DNA cytosine methyltransferase [Glycomyces amatae]
MTGYRQPALLEPHSPACRTVDLFAGPGGWDEGARLLGLDLGIEGIEINKDACATARAAGHRRRHTDVRAVAPADYLHCGGYLASPPCPTFSVSGKRTGLGKDYQAVLDSWTSVGWGATAAEAMRCVADVQDERTALLTVAGIWALTLLTAGQCEFVAMEQVPAVEFAWEDLAAELTAIGCASVNVGVLDAVNFGLPSRRKRAYLVASRHGQTRTARRFAPEYTPFGPGCLPTPTEGTPRSMASALSWGPGHHVVTRGNRRPTGGGTFRADRPAWCLTGKARGWHRDDGLRLTPGEAGYLNGFGLDYPWQGSRSAQFQQAADVVAPPMAAHVIAAALGIEASAVIDGYVEDLYERAPVLAA